MTDTADKVTIDRTGLDEFTTAYVECALWSSTDDDGDALERDYQLHNIAEDTLAVMVSDCQDFQQLFGEGYIDHDPSQAGHDFWLTRNGHGAGFWDGDWSQPYEQYKGPNPPTGAYETVGDYLTAMSKPYGEFNLYVGDDGMIHGQ